MKRSRNCIWSICCVPLIDKRWEFCLCHMKARFRNIVLYIIFKIWWKLHIMVAIKDEFYFFYNFNLDRNDPSMFWISGSFGFSKELSKKFIHSFMPCLYIFLVFLMLIILTLAFPCWFGNIWSLWICTVFFYMVNWIYIQCFMQIHQKVLV